MGGMRSGNWGERPDRKTTVEESYALPVRDFLAMLADLRSSTAIGNRSISGTSYWTSTNGQTNSIGTVLSWNGGAPVMTLDYRWRGYQHVRTPIRLQSTRTNFGGRRWWFTCPLIVQGNFCNRRVGKLYRPPGRIYFGCRQCHDLTYQSCQEAHKVERIFGRMGLSPEAARSLDRGFRESYDFSRQLYGR
jgi:hypothetical protein